MNPRAVSAVEQDETIEIHRRGVVTSKSGQSIRDVPLIDVFAGCGGFSEGFSRYSGRHRFRLALAVDSNEAAHQTHLLRAFFHQFSEAPQEYYALLEGRNTLEELASAHPEQWRTAGELVKRQELGKDDAADRELHATIGRRIGGAKNWVLIGGPPCQAYSVAGRVRNRGNSAYKAENDKRHFLYREYLNLLVTHWPAVFVMENVPGILNARVGGEKIWHRIIEDLSDPVSASGRTELDGTYDGYRLFSLVTPDRGLDIFGKPTLKPEEYIVRCEQFGIPQARHRVFILGIRSDIDVQPGQLEPHPGKVCAGAVLNDLPPLRSGLTRTTDSDGNWLAAIETFLKTAGGNVDDTTRDVMDEATRAFESLRSPPGGRGGRFVAHDASRRENPPPHLQEWLCDPALSGVCNHETKAHMASDIHRYIFAASHARLDGKALRLEDFPEWLLPDHENVKPSRSEDSSKQHFADRFAVIRENEPARTVVSHIAKDGHYYIHPDVQQGRSLTVREAARIQTFPDNFYFPGNRTEQYRQVGNAVPPYLAYQIAGIVDDILSRAADA